MYFARAFWLGVLPQTPNPLGISAQRTLRSALDVPASIAVWEPDTASPTKGFIIACTDLRATLSDPATSGESAIQDRPRRGLRTGLRRTADAFALCVRRGHTTFRKRSQKNIGTTAKSSLCNWRVSGFSAYQRLQRPVDSNFSVMLEEPNFVIACIILPAMRSDPGASGQSAIPSCYCA